MKSSDNLSIVSYHYNIYYDSSAAMQACKVIHFHKSALLSALVGIIGYYAYKLYQFYCFLTVCNEICYIILIMKYYCNEKLFGNFLAFFVLVNYMDRSGLFCSYESLIKSLQKVTPFCVISGKLWLLNYYCP